jgi:transposase
MRFVPVKSAPQQAAMLVNALRGHLAEFGIIAPAGRHRVPDLLSLLQGANDAELPALACEALRSPIAELHALKERIEAIEGVIVREHKASEISRRLATIPGIGPITASAIAATVTYPAAFKSGRELAAWIGLVLIPE